MQSMAHWPAALPPCTVRLSALRAEQVSGRVARVGEAEQRGRGRDSARGSMAHRPQGQAAPLPELHSGHPVLPKVLSWRLLTKGTEEWGSDRIYGDNRTRR